MNAKWYFSTLILALTLLGVCQKQDAVANQEVVLEFVNAQTTKQDVQNAITDVKNQLQDIGATNIKVHEAKDGTLKITYYSDVKAANIKSILSPDSQLVFEYLTRNQEQKDSHSSKKQSDYNLDVFEINQGTGSSSLEGKYVLEFKYDYDRFSNPNVYFPLWGETTNGLNHSIETAYKVNSAIAIAIDNTSHKEPEVRAGPIC